MTLIRDVPLEVDVLSLKVGEFDARSPVLLSRVRTPNINGEIE